MQANAVTLLDVFEPKIRLEVPLFQRQYVWNQAHQWEPLWEDISRKFTEYLEGRTDGPVHFLGAMVFDQKLTPTSYVARRQVIDGQQRLTTFQLFLAAFRDFCKCYGHGDLAEEIRKFTLNTGMMSNPEVDKFKVWPTNLDREQFADVMSVGSRGALEAKYPPIRRPRARKIEPRPRMVEAYLYFFDALTEYFVGDDQASPTASETPLTERLNDCFRALQQSLQVVIIDLGSGDDPQVIFETLNARGEPLLPADLLRNFIFLRAGRLGENQEELYKEFWSGFDDLFWREEVRQGRLNRPRSDQFVQHFLTSRLTRDVSAKHLYVEYKHWIEKDHPFGSIREELQTLARQREDFRRLIDPRRDDVLFQLANFLESFDISTAFPLLLFILDSGDTDSDLIRMSAYIESYLLRRAVCGLTSKNYNRILLSLKRPLQNSPEPYSTTMAKFLGALAGDSSEWPSDEEFHHAWTTQNVYQTLGPQRINYILRRLNDAHLSGKNEQIIVTGPLTIEHIMPSSWTANWPLQDGSQGLSLRDMYGIDSNDPRSSASKRRNALVNTIGNLTLLTQPLNSTLSNSPWQEKQKLILSHSLLPMNSSLHTVTTWDEDAIHQRSEDLFAKALNLWPRPVI